MRILIIEDDEKLCEAMRFALEMEGYIADVCHDGDDGFRWAREQAHDLILLDQARGRTYGNPACKPRANLASFYAADTCLGTGCGSGGRQS